jgi:hypothetical protein
MRKPSGGRRSLTPGWLGPTAPAPVLRGGLFFCACAGANKLSGLPRRSDSPLDTALCTGRLCLSFGGRCPNFSSPRTVMKRRIVGYHVDSENHWVAELECGHEQHVRHDPPLTERAWVLTEEGRASRLGQELNCVICDSVPPPA